MCIFLMPNNERHAQPEDRLPLTPEQEDRIEYECFCEGACDAVRMSGLRSREALNRFEQDCRLAEKLGHNPRGKE